MSTFTAHISRGAARRTLLVAVLATTVISVAGSYPSRPAAIHELDDDDAPGSALPVAGTPAADAIEAYVEHRSYVRGQQARLRVVTTISRPAVRILAAGHGGDGPMQGRPLPAHVGVTPSRVVVRIGAWPSGLYYARLKTRDGRLGYAPFVVRPRRLGEHRVAVVLPTNTWQAYNFFDADRDGKPDSWYGNPLVATVELERPFVDRGVPPQYGRGFFRWLAVMHKHPDFLTDDDLESTSGEALAQAYDLIVFPGHEEYVTRHEYDAVERYRDLGGNLAFLSANNFFYRVVRRGTTITRDGRWRDLGRPEARLIGIQYVDWYQQRYPNKPYVVVGAHRLPWLFGGTGFAEGVHFGVYGIEIDARTHDSPRGIKVLARIPDIFGPGKSAEMTYYVHRGAKVFAAGVINFGASAIWPGVRVMMSNLWSELSEP